MPLLPVFLDLQGRQCLLVGSGEMAGRKLHLLQQAGAVVTVSGNDFSDSDLAGMALVVAASDDQMLNERISLAAQSRQIPVNVVDQPHLCSFVFPAIVERGPITVAVSTGGALPVLARLLRARIETLLPPSLGDFAVRAAAFRQQVRQQLPEMRQRLRFWDGLLQQQLIGSGSDLQMFDSAEALDRKLATFLAAENAGHISVVGSGTGDPDLLTFKALRCMQACDLLVFDDSVPAVIVNLARRDARRHPLQPGEDAATLLHAEAGRGMHVVWLLAGDPLSYRNVPLLLAQWQAAGISIDMVPGIIDQAGVFPDER